MNEIGKIIEMKRREQLVPQMLLNKINNFSNSKKNGIYSLEMFEDVQLTLAGRAVNTKNIDIIEDFGANMYHKDSQIIQMASDYLTFIAPQMIEQYTEGSKQRVA